jgi:hypothetical protein
MVTSLLGEQAAARASSLPSPLLSPRIVATALSPMKYPGCIILAKITWVIGIFGESHSYHGFWYLHSGNLEEGNAH